MGSRYLIDLADVCRRTGYPVVLVDGWETRARGSGGYGAGRPNHVMAHHTASGPSSDGWPDVDYCCSGSPDAPLCNLYLSRTGTIYVCAAGATNTNGSGVDPCKLIADDTMNSSAVGIEAANNGVGEVWPVVQQNAYVELVIELCAAYGIGNAQIHAHFEWAPSRKIDPAGSSRYADGGASWDMTLFRSDALDAPPPEPAPEPPLPDEETATMPFIIQNRETGEVALVYGDRQVVGLAGDDLSDYERRFGAALRTDPVVWAGFIQKAS